MHTRSLRLKLGALLMLGATAKPALAQVLAVPIPDRPDPLLEGLSVSDDAATQGMWSASQSWPIVSIHVTLLPDGSVLTFGSPVGQGAQDGRTFVRWDPWTGTQTTTPNSQNVNSFCAAAMLQPQTGGLLVSGGNEALQSTTFDYRTGTPTTESSSLASDRWYATMTMLPDGRTLITGGSFPYAINVWQNPDSQQSLNDVSMTPEIYTPGVGWSSLFGANSREAFGPDHNRWWYPHQWVAPDGNVFGISSEKWWRLDPSGLGSILSFGDFKTGQDDTTRPNIGPTATAVMFDVGRVLQVGGNGYTNEQSTVSSERATVLDISGGAPVITDVTSMQFRRQWLNSIVDPTGKVIVTGGSQHNNQGDPDAVYQAEQWDPDTGNWSPLASASIIRNYHSTTVLLEDGAIFSSGGGVPGPVTNFNYEIFYPPYLFESATGPDLLADRPRMVSIDDTSFGYDVGFQIEMADGRTISRVAFIGLSTTTHSFNMGQRYVPADFSQADNVLTVATPPNANLAPPGYYLVFAVDDAGVPSRGFIVRLADPECSTDVECDDADPCTADLCSDGFCSHPDTGTCGPEDPIAYYPMDDGSGTTASDVGGAQNDGTLVGGATFTTEGALGGGVALDGASGSVDLPDGLIRQCDDFTFAAWVWLDKNPDWSRIFDFGSSTTTNMFLTPKVGGANTLRFALKVPGINGGAEEQISYPFTFPLGTWTHVAVVLEGDVGTLFVNGAAVATAPITGNPSDMGSTINNWLGDSQYAADPNLSGRLDDVWISCRAYSDQEIEVLASLDAASCGDATCDSAEDCSSCPADCGACPPACNDGTCDAGEDCSSCPADCGACPPACGDGTCDAGEDCSSCAGDCGDCPTVCGDGTCDAGEDCSSCAGDCGDCPSDDTLIDADFTTGAEDFTYADDTFRGTSQPGYASGTATVGALEVALGGLDDDDIYGMSGGWSRSFVLTEPSAVDLTVGYALAADDAYESAECSQVLVSVDGVLYGAGGSDAVVEICSGGGQSGLFTTRTAFLDAGSHTIIVGGYNSAKTELAELTTVQISQVRAIRVVPECVEDADCDDADPCTADVCGAGVCSHPDNGVCTDPLALYSFEESTGTSAGDGTGNGHTATLLGGASFTSGLLGGAVDINGGAQAVELPDGLLEPCDDLTIATWVFLDQKADWARIFDFGSSTAANMFLTPKVGGADTLRFAMKVPGVNGGAEQTLSFPFVFPVATWTHVAVVLEGDTGTLYVNGDAVVTGPIAGNPSDLGTTVNNWLGDSQYAADPALDGLLDEVEISCRAYDATEIVALANVETCFDGVQNQDETGIDCGGTSCAACPACGDGICNGSESCFTCATDCAVCAPLIDEDFSADAGDFTYVDDTFRSTAAPTYASGTLISGALQVSLGGVNDDDIIGMSGGFRRAFSLGQAGPVDITVGYSLTSDAAYEDNECSQVLVAVDGRLYGNAGTDTVVEICSGGGQSGTFIFTTESLAAGSHTLTVGGYNNQKTELAELTTIQFGRVLAELVPPECTADTQCDDADPCTVDLCSAGACTNEDNGLCIPDLNVAFYPMDDGAGLVAADISGNDENGALTGGASFTTEGQIGGAVDIDGGTQSVDLPDGLVSACDDFTFASWVQLDSNANWNRIFDFGDDTTTNMYLTPKAGAANTLRFAMKVPGINGGAEQQISYPFTFPLGAWTHVAVVLDGDVGTLFVDGTAVATNTILGNPADLGETVNNWLGQSQWPDPGFNGRLDEVRIACRAFTDQEIAVLANPSAQASSRRSLFETTEAAVSQLDFEETLDALGTNAGLLPNGELLYQQMIDSYATAPGNLSSVVHCGDETTGGQPTLNGYPIECDRLEAQQFDHLGDWFAIAAVNRIDLAPEDGSHCGNQRLVFASNAAIGNGRMFAILEAELPNPSPSSGATGCLPIAEFWQSLEAVADPVQRGMLLRDAFLVSGIPGFGPFMSAANLTAGTGQIRTNAFNDDRWTMREFKLVETAGEARVIPFPVDSSPHGALWNDLSALPDGDACRQSFLNALDGLLTDNPAAMAFAVGPECEDAESRNDFTAENYPLHLLAGDPEGFQSELEARLAGTGLTPLDIASRARFAGSCIGCHQESRGSLLGNGVQAPSSLGFVHVSESFMEECEDGPCFPISQALRDVFLPHRRSVMDGLLAFDTGGVSSSASAPAQTVASGDLTFEELIALDEAASGSADVSTLGGQPATVSH